MPPPVPAAVDAGLIGRALGLIVDKTDPILRVRNTLPSTIIFKLKYPPFKHTQPLSRVLIIPAQKAGCNPNKIAVLRRKIL
jgi:hypothetical protein